MGKGNRSNVGKSGCLDPIRFTAAFCHFSYDSFVAHAETACFKPFKAASKSPHKRSGYSKFSTITADKFSNPCDFIGTFINDAEFDKLPNSQTLQTCFCRPCPGPWRRPNEYSNAKVGLIVSERSRKLLMIDVFPLIFETQSR